MLLPGSLLVTAELPVYPLEHVPDTLRGWNNVERGRDRTTLLEVADPKLASGELPLDVGTFLIGIRRENVILLAPFLPFYNV